MHRLIFVLLVIVVALVVNRMQSRHRALAAPMPTSSPAPHTYSLWPPGSEASQQFHCDGRQYCSQMTSRAEAVYFTRHCPNTKMDGDHDGIPCENDSRF